MTTLNQTIMVHSLLVPTQVEEVEVAARHSHRMARLCAKLCSKLEGGWEPGIDYYKGWHRNLWPFYVAFYAAD